MALPRVVSGLHCTIPNGVSAPGKVLPPWALPTSGSTSSAGSPVSAPAAADAGRGATRDTVSAAPARRPSSARLPGRIRAIERIAMSPPPSARAGDQAPQDLALGVEHELPPLEPRGAREDQEQVLRVLGHPVAR